MAVTRRDVIRLIVVIGIVLLIALPTITYPLGRDQGEFATIGRGILNGRIPYVDLWNPKPPAVFYVYAAAMALFGQTVPALRALDLLAYPVIAAALWQIGRRLASPRVGEWAVLLFGVFYFTETFWTLTQNDGLVLLPMSLAAVCMIEAVFQKRASAWTFAAGMLSGWVFWFKYPFALFAAALVIGFVLALGLRNWRKAIRPVLLFVVGWLLTVGGGAAYLIAIGAWDALIESVRVTTGYTALGFSPDEFIRGFSIGIGSRLLYWGVLFALAAFALIPRRASTENLGESQPRIGWIIGCWLIAGTVILLIQAKGYDYHWLPMLPPLAMYGAATVERLIARVRMTGSPAAGLARGITAALFLAIPVIGIGSRTAAYLTGAEDQTAYFARFQAGEFVADETLRVTEFLQARVLPGDSLFIWGFRPEVYYTSRLNPAVRFIFQYPLTASWYPPEWREETVEILWAALPPYVLVLQADYLDWVTGRTDTDSNMLLQEYEELNDWLIFNYTYETQIGNFLIWRRN